ncbi:unnamed protein product [Symbiodinium natans]|uniref:SbsA Ig-like domain-containing protein n=1 Tax=Symbiodinium natans TaxID=878477 RepID=A0A812ILY5_9DINO|nr:unnamed protein product [Symbiodinium natans]
MAPGARRCTAWLRILALWLGVANGDVQQQFLKTQTVSLTHLQDVSWPDGSDVQDSQAWTNNNQNVRTNSIVEIEFAENIQASFGYITIQPAISGIGASSASATTISVPSTDVVISGQSLFLNDPSSAGGRQIVFAEETVYTVSFDAGLIQNLAATDTNAAFSIQFTTGDFTSPTLLTMSPADNSPNVAVTTTIVFTFSEDVLANPDVSGTAPTWGIQDPYQRQTPFSVAPKCSDAQITVSGASATITIDTVAFPILPCSQYQVVFAAKCFTDTSVNLNYAAALPSSSFYDWWTSCITSYSPTVGTYGVPINTDIVLTFSEQILRGTGNIVFTPLGEASQNYDVTDASRVLIDSSQLQVTIVGNVASDYLCLSLGFSGASLPVLDCNDHYRIFTSSRRSLGWGVVHAEPTQQPGRRHRSRGADMQKCKGKPVDITIGAGHARSYFRAFPEEFAQACLPAWTQLRALAASL